MTLRYFVCDAQAHVTIFNSTGPPSNQLCASKLRGALARTLAPMIGSSLRLRITPSCFERDIAALLDGAKLQGWGMSHEGFDYSCLAFTTSSSSKSTTVDVTACCSFIIWADDFAGPILARKMVMNSHQKCGCRNKVVVGFVYTPRSGAAMM
jgi:hypothetical protein